MSTSQAGNETSAVVAAAQTGDESAFATLVEPRRRELQVHCYRMLGSLEDAEDMVQETFLRAWRRRETYQGRSTFRAWLYRIATNACLDAIARRPALAASPPPQAGAGAPPSEVSWLQPYPDHLLEGAAPSESEPDAVVVAKETIELAFLVAVQHVPARPRATLILRDVLGWSAKDTAELLDTSVAAVNSALQRARATLKAQLPEQRLDWAPEPDPSEAELALVQRYVAASERGDAGALAELIHADARFTMPPDPLTHVGRDEMIAFWVEGGLGTDAIGEMRCVVTRANRQPAVACYARRPGEAAFRPLALDVLRIEGGAIAEITTFVPELFPAFGLPASV